MFLTFQKNRNYLKFYQENLYNITYNLDFYTSASIFGDVTSTDYNPVEICKELMKMGFKCYAKDVQAEFFSSVASSFHV